MRSLHRAFVLSLMACFVSLLAAPGAVTASCDTALLVMDVQTWFLEQDWANWVTATGEDIVPAIQRLLVHVRNAGIPVIYIRDLGLDRRGDGEHLQVHEDIAPLEGDAVFTKTEGNALSNPDLVAHLESNGIQRLLISGIASNGCVQMTFRSAYRAGYEIVIITDAHAHSDGDALATAAMNRTWLGWGLAGYPMDEMDWSSIACSEYTADPEISETNLASEP